MIQHWKGLNLEITDFIYHYDPTPSGEIIPSETSKYVIRGYYFIMRDGVKKARLEEQSNNISDQCEAKGTGILSDSLLGEAQRG